ncbi:YkvA family protein [Roseibium sediminicola]|uniref:YkvA family protein n=1 Tax=Roseibium sediminicola TaxID=2933272 RepID=A0ABT0GST4_9HYPH|nr:YkvA family protein [Roseibium sp. CAU 1639]MCK7612504.1 YkvA family protein [Roseibium sp. CAU 1639]
MNTTFQDMGFDPEILGPEDEQKITIREKLLATAKKAARQVPFMEDVIAGYYCALDPSTPTKVRATLLAALAYFVLPVDTIPDFILGIGFGDDATVLMAAFAMMRSHIRNDHYDAAREALKDDKL